MMSSHQEVQFRKKTPTHFFKAAGDFSSNIISQDDFPNSSDHRYLQISAALSTLFGLLLIYFFIFCSHLVLVGHFTFLLVSAVHLVIEIVKFIPYSNVDLGFSLTFENFCNFVASYAMLVVGTYVISVLFGADLTENIEGTLIFSCHISSFVFIPLYFHVGARFLSLITIEEKPRTYIESCNLIVCSGVLVGAWFGAFVIPLDWDRDWQKWPIPCVIGSIFGFTLSNLFLLVCTIFNKIYLPPVFNISKIKSCSS